MNAIGTIYGTGTLLAVLRMEKWFSPLQHDILAILRERSDWSRPKDILGGLGREPTPSNRTAVSKALARLWRRELIELATPERCNVGKSYLYRARR